MGLVGSCQVINHRLIVHEKRVHYLLRKSHLMNAFFNSHTKIIIHLITYKLEKPSIALLKTHMENDNILLFKLVNESTTLLPARITNIIYHAFEQTNLIWK